MKKTNLVIILTAAVTTIVVMIVFFFLMPLIGPGFMHSVMMGNQTNAENLDTATSAPSEAGLFEVSWRSDSDPVPLNQIHTWTLHIETPDGQPVENAAVLVDGGMPAHGHGLPTSPEVTEYLGNGDYRIEGLRFQMPGIWEVKFIININGQSDSITFNLNLK